MHPNLSLLEQLQIVSGFAPISLGTARTADVVSLKNYRRCLILFHKGIGLNGDDPTITILQGTDVAFGTNKALTFADLYVKEDPTTLADVGQWTKVSRSAINTYTHTDAGEKSLMWAIEFKAEDLDIANGYDCIRASVGDAGTAAHYGDVIYILSDPVQMLAPASMPSAIID